MKTERTKLYPTVKINSSTWEIDEFDCASIFLLEGTERAMLIDTGMGIGDLRGAVEMLTDKPLTVVISHGHVDHTGNAWQFDELWINPADAQAPIPQELERRRFDTERIAQRQKGCIGAPYTMFNLYPFDIETDLCNPPEGSTPPVIHDLTDGMQFDLGGGRIITAFACPGHSAGEMIFLDEQNRMLFCGDALNFNLGVSAMPMSVTLEGLKKMQELSDKYDGIYNGHHDFRALGAPLDPDCLPNAIEILENALAGNMMYCEAPSFWGQSVPLTRREDFSPVMKPAGHFKGSRVLLRKGRNFLMIDPEKL